jgi:hypothetical protein
LGAELLQNGEETWVVAKMALQEKAAGRGDVAEMRRLVAAGVDVDELGEDEGTALLWAAYYGHVEAIRVLVELGRGRRCRWRLRRCWMRGA